MNTKSIIVGLAALAGIAALSTPASAMPVGLAAPAQTSEVEKVVLVCDAYGRCWRRPNYYYGAPAYYGPRFYGPRYYGRRWRRW
ncbi:MAG: hypothetical protein K2X60_09545 [Xanthobacteraceae bacterium]|nr:hypothetical protein [Xanthobacteraceae bacterium]